MSRTSFDNFARAAESKALGDTEVAGRYAFQAVAERRILQDILNKLQLDAEDRLLEIGCGSGNLLIPLAHFVAETIGIDNASAIERLRARAPLCTNLRGIPGDFLDLRLELPPFNKILIYSVLHYLSSREEILRFIDLALAICAPGGRILLGDIPNTDRKKRFASSTQGQRINIEWQRQITTAGSHAFNAFPNDPTVPHIDDDLVLKILQHVRMQGIEAYLLPQPSSLPFGNTREDILIVAPI